MSVKPDRMVICDRKSNCVNYNNYCINYCRDCKFNNKQGIVDYNGYCDCTKFNYNFYLPINKNER